MHDIALAIPILAGVFLTNFLCFLPLMMMGEQSKEARKKARERRMAEHRMNARLLRLNL